MEGLPSLSLFQKSSGVEVDIEPIESESDIETRENYFQKPILSKNLARERFTNHNTIEGKRAEENRRARDMAAPSPSNESTQFRHAETFHPNNSQISKSRVSQVTPVGRNSVRRMFERGTRKKTTRFNRNN